MDAIILAGGLGTRLRARVADRPKPMAPIAGRPFLAFLLDYLARQGISRVVLSVGYGRDSIIGFFGERYGGLDLAYAVEEEPLGTGGAIRHAMAQSEADPLWVVNGDTFLALDYGAMRAAHLKPGVPAMSMALRHEADAGRYGTVVLDGGRIVGFAASGSGAGLINSGVYLVSRSLFAAGAPERFSFERDFLPEAVSRLEVRAHVTPAWFIDIGIPEDYDRAQTELPAHALG